MWTAETAVIAYEPAKIGVRDIIERIEDSGYGASLKTGGGDEADEMRERKEKEIQRWKVLRSQIYTLEVGVR